MKYSLVIILILALLNSSAQTADQYFEQGVAKGKAGDHYGAVEDFKKAMSLHPQLAVTLISRGLQPINAIESETKSSPIEVKDRTYGCVVMPTKMNVLYRGVKNPISISVPGIPPDFVRPTITNGSLRADSKNAKGNYIAEVQGGSEAIVNVSAEIDGKLRFIGSFKFRVKDVPPPVSTVAGVKQEGMINANRLAAAPTVIPQMQNFDFELYFQVTKFDIVFQVGTDLITKPVTGSRIPEDALDQFKRLKLGSRIYIENITAVMLDENNRPAAGVTPIKLAPISLKLH